MDFRIVADILIPIGVGVFILLLLLLPKFIPAQVKRVVVLLSLIFAGLNVAIIQNQFSDNHLDMINHTPNQAAVYFGYLLIALALINIIVAFKNLRYSGYILGLLVVSLPFMYLMSW